MRTLLKILALIAIFGYIEAGKWTSLARARGSIIAQKYNIPYSNTTSTTTTEEKKLSIRGGSAANPGQFPSVVYIYVTVCGDDWYCTGVLIYYNYVITSAICIGDAEDIDVLLGEYDLSAWYPVTRSKSRVRMYARQWTFHESCTGPFFNNIGIIQLPLYAVANSNITTIGMNLLNVNTYYVGNIATAVGWGETGNGYEPPNLLYTSLKIISQTECAQSWAGTPLMNVFCAKTPTTSVGQGLCYGDDGGPLIYQNLLIGITSYYNQCCNSTYPGIFTPIAPYYNWIIQKTSDAALGKFWVVPSTQS